METYEHQPLNTEITAIAGHEVITGEVRMSFRGREILYLTGYAVIDTA